MARAAGRKHMQLGNVVDRKRLGFTGRLRVLQGVALLVAVEVDGEVFANGKPEEEVIGNSLRWDLRRGPPRA